MDSKYTHNELDGIGHCPFCRGVIIKNFKSKDCVCKIMFQVRCPHCQKNSAIVMENGKMSIGTIE